MASAFSFAGRSDFRASPLTPPIYHFRSSLPPADLKAYNEELKARLKAGDAVLEEFAQHREHLEAEFETLPKTKLQVALRFDVEGVSSKPLIECLRSDEELSAADRECLAAYFEGRLVADQAETTISASSTRPP